MERSGGRSCSIKLALNVIIYYNIFMKRALWSSDSFWMDAIDSKRYRLIARLEELIQLETTSFYKDRDFHFMLLPVTTGSISSPMGLGSDSLPVKIELQGRKTYLADSMQFLLEYGCRLFDNGCY